MSVPLLDLKIQYDDIQGEVREALEKVIQRQSFIMGPEVGVLEESVARYSNSAHGIGCASGTDALLLSLKCLDLSPGDEVVTVPFTFFATAGAIVNAGGTPVFVDIDPDTYLMDTAAAVAAAGDRARAYLPVHLFGQMVPLEHLSAGRPDLPIIEDAAQAIGARRAIVEEWRMSGSMGYTGCFSFFPSKNLGGWGDGGMIVTGDEALATRLRRLRTHGGARQYHHDEVGINSRLDTIQAAVLLVKLARLDHWAEARRQNAAHYDERFAEIDAVTTPVTLQGNEHVFHQYTIRVERRDELRDYLKSRGIGCAVYYPVPLHLQPCFSDLGYRQGQFPHAERACREVLSLPIYPELSRDQQDEVADAILEFFT